MLIDWFTVAAQALNFLILVWLLKRFLYKPILNAIDAREKRIATELGNADARMAEARQERDEYIRKNKEFDQQRAALLNNAKDEAMTERQRLIAEARKESDALRTTWQEALRNEHLSLSEEFSRRTREEVFAIAKKTLADLASTSLEEQMTSAFIRRLHELSNEEKNAIQSAFTSPSPAAIIRSTCDLPSTQRDAIERAVKDLLTIETQVAFEHTPDLVSGIELTANGHKIAWSIGQYLSSMKNSIEDLLKERPKSIANADASPEQHANEQPI